MKLNSILLTFKNKKKNNILIQLYKVKQKFDQQKRKYKFFLHEKKKNKNFSQQHNAN